MFAGLPRLYLKMFAWCYSLQLHILCGTQFANPMQRQETHDHTTLPSSKYLWTNTSGSERRRDILISEGARSNPAVANTIFHQTNKTLVSCGPAKSTQKEQASNIRTQIFHYIHLSKQNSWSCQQVDLQVDLQVPNLRPMNILAGEAQSPLAVLGTSGMPEKAKLRP